jgi:hypothetical protein
MSDGKDTPTKAATPVPTAAPVPTLPVFPDLGRADGPWSFADAPEGEAFVSFGALKVPAFPSLHTRVEIDPATKRVGAVSVLVDDCSVQLRVLAASRGAGLWGDVRRAITDRVRRSGGRTQVVEGTFGPELIVNLPMPLAGGLVGVYTRRFLGIDGDRWMIRVSAGGPSVLTDATVAKVDSLLSHCAVERGSDPVVSGRIMALAFPAGEGEVAAADGADNHPSFFVDDLLDTDAGLNPGEAAV